jgi:hypothetical protein
MTDHFTSIALVAQPNWRNFFVRMAKELKARQGGNIYLYCPSELSKAYYVSQNKDQTFAEIIVAPQECPGITPTVSDEKAVFAQASANEERLGETFNTFLVTNRHLGRGFAPGGFFHPRSPLSERTSLVETYAIYNQIVAFWDTEIQEKQLTLILNQKSPAVVAVAGAHGVPVRNPYESHHENLYHWGVDEKETNPAVENAFHSMPKTEVSAAVTAPPAGHAVARDVLLSRYGTVGLLKITYQMVREQAYNHYKGNNRQGMYYLTSKIRYVVRQWRDGRWLLRQNSPTLSDLGDKRFVFFPLHVEPEIALQGKSPEFLVQIAAILSLARHLPANTVLVVKEHMSGAGRRPPGFYRQIRDLKNVVWLDVRELGLEVVRKATAVATISGTAGFEAAVLGIPVLAFGRHNLFNFLPHVFEIREEEQLRGYLKTILGDDVSKTAAIEAGARFLESVKSVSFDLDEYNHLTASGFNDDSLLQAVDQLDKSLSQPEMEASG